MVLSVSIFTRMHIRLGELKRLIKEAKRTVKPNVRKQTSIQLRKQITDALAKLGFRVKNRNIGKGALKAWLIGPKTTPEAVVKALNDAGIKTEPSQYHAARGLDHGFEVDIQELGVDYDRFDVPAGQDQLFVGVHAGKYAADYAHGIDPDDFPD